ncbi:MAG: proprotein convertase P-domain-containing protein, partial [Methyloprofundus sp.]|nr:proprotein convertase P-domain-containing protein [Methyloprofundus sp.]
FSNAFGFGALNLQAALQKAVDWKTSSTQLTPLQTLDIDAQVYSEHNLIPDASAVGLSKTQTISSDLLAESLLLEITIESLEPDKADGNKPIDISDYLIQVTSPAGTQSITQTPFNAFRSGYDMNNMPLISHAFYGEPIDGEWTLQVWDVNDHIKPGSNPIEYDNAIKAPGEGQLTRWQLTFYGREAE